MSAGAHGQYPGEPPVTVIHDLSRLAPGVERMVRAALDECHANGLDAVVYETERTEATQAIYYARGRTQIPPTATCTNARTALQAYHIFRVAVDVISASRGWDVTDDWRKAVTAIFRIHGMAWGGDWPGHFKDFPHYQPVSLPHLTPSDDARARFARDGGPEGCWKVWKLDT
jgi:hypothetical protein